MKFEDLVEPIVLDSVLENARRVWARQGTKIVSKFRCTSGPRKNRVVSNPGQCNKPINLKKRFQFKKTKARLGKRMAMKARRTKRMNPFSKRLSSLNKGLRRR